VAASVARGGLRVLCGVAIIAAFAQAPAAKAATAGIVRSGPASYCDPSSSQVFSRFGDSSYYARMLNGGFESGSTGWVLSGGSRVVSGNESYYLSGNQSDSHSLLLPAGSSAYSGTVCFALGDWHLRLMMKRLSTTGGLHVQVIVPSLLGILTVLDGGTVSGTTAWSPSPRMALLLSNVISLLGTKAVAFRFTPVGAGASFQIDDVYLDPWKCT
jgi:hypothetical protein